MHMKTISREKARGFTLVELLIGISIVAILAALILPAVSKTIEKAQRSGSVSRLKGILNASALYSAEYKGNLPPYECSEWGPSLYSGLSYKYISEFLPEIYGDNNYKMFARPGDKLDIAGLPDKKRILGGKSPWSYARNIELPLMASAPRVNNTVHPSRLEKPSGTFLFVETQRNGAISLVQLSHIYFDDPGSEGKTAVGMVDGHVEMITRENMIGSTGSSPGAWTPEQRLLWFGYSNSYGRTDY